jgi:hypothetical protein
MGNENKNLQLEIAKLIGQPISTQLPVPVEVSAIADAFTAEPGEKIWRYSTVDKDADVVLNVDTDGKITVIKKTPLSDVELTFQGLNSKLKYVLVEDVLGEPDTQILARKKEAITRGMDKSELKMIIDGIEAGTNVPSNQGIQSHTVSSAEDLYDVILAMKHKVEDYGDGYTLLVGSTVKEKIDTYDKDKASSFNYNVTLTAKLKELGIEVVKVFGKVDRGSGEVNIMGAKKLILVAKNSRIAEGKPVKFVRRRISPDIAKLMGANVNEAQRALIVNPVPVQTELAGTHYNLLAYGVYGFESVIFCITNPLAICTADASIII